MKGCFFDALGRPAERGQRGGSDFKGKFQIADFFFERVEKTAALKLKEAQRIPVIYRWNTNASSAAVNDLREVFATNRQNFALTIETAYNRSTLSDRMVTNQRLRLKVFLPSDKPEVKTLTTVFAGANWMERETYDFFGVIFEGHPNLKRILNVDDMLIFPMRKEYPLEDQTREVKNDLMFGR